MLTKQKYCKYIKYNSYMYFNQLPTEMFKS